MEVLRPQPSRVGLDQKPTVVWGIRYSGVCAPRIFLCVLWVVPDTGNRVG